MKHISISLAAFFLFLAFGFTLSGKAEALSRAPTAENLELRILRDLPYTGVLKAHDPDGDLAVFEISTKPRKGEIKVLEDGRFQYTPHPGKKGRDYFGYRVRDAAGNISQEATAIIRIEKEEHCSPPPA